MHFDCWSQEPWLTEKTIQQKHGKYNLGQNKEQGVQNNA